MAVFQPQLTFHLSLAAHERQDSIVSVALSLELLPVGVTHCPFSGVRTFLSILFLNKANALVPGDYLKTRLLHSNRSLHPCQPNIVIFSLILS